MGAGLYRSERAYREAVDSCAALLAPQLGRDIRKIIFAEIGDPAINETCFCSAGAVRDRICPHFPVEAVGHYARRHAGA